VDYIAFRGVCFNWRACTPSPRDPTLRDPRLRPRGWVALCDGDAVRPDDACEIPFFNTRTARRIRVHLPELRRHRIVGFSDGLVILLHLSTTAVRVLHPFTCVVVDLPPLASVFRDIGRWKEHRLNISAVVCGAKSANSIAVVVRFPWKVFAAEPDDTDWKLINRNRDVWSMLSFQGNVYATLSPSKEIVQLYPPPLGGGDSQLVVIAQIPNMFGDHIHFCQPFLVESGGRMLVADRYPPAAAELGGVGYGLYEVHLRSGELIPVKCLGDRALFLNCDRCLCFGQGPPFSDGQLHLLLCKKRKRCRAALADDWTVRGLGGALPDTQHGG
jgi:hypothetical protein